MSINRIYSGEVAMALLLAASVTDRRPRSRSRARSRRLRRGPKAIDGRRWTANGGADGT